MVRMVLDGEVQSASSATGTVADVIDARLRASPGEPRAVMRAFLDGEEFSGDRLEALSSRSAGTVGEIVVETRLASQLARDALHSAAAFAAQVSEAVRATAAELRQGRIGDGNRRYQESLEALQILVEALRAAGAFLSQSEAIGALERDLAPCLLQLECLQRNRDWIAVADHLEFELGAALRAWPARLDALRLDASVAPSASGAPR